MRNEYLSQQNLTSGRMQFLFLAANIGCISVFILFAGISKQTIANKLNSTYRGKHAIGLQQLPVTRSHTLFMNQNHINDTKPTFHETKSMFNHIEASSVDHNKQCNEGFRKTHLMTVENDGRTGNHVFQLATLLAVSNQTCFQPVRSEGFGIMDEIFNLQNIVKMNRIESFQTFKIIKEPGWGIYDSTLTKKISPDFNWTLGGYRQSYRYFQNFAALVRSSFRFKDNITRDVSRFLSQKLLGINDKVCIHVRRGDMVNLSKEDGRRPASRVFIRRSINYMKKYLNFSYFSLIVVSDDKRWCKRKIKGDNVFISPFKDVGRDLYLLTQCDHNIVTLGTFGWMGAWLNETGAVIYNKMFPLPNSGIAKAHRKGDYYPSHWVGL